MSSGVLVVGRSKKQPDPDKEPVKLKTIGVRTTVDWSEWLDRGARYCRTDVAKLIDVAVVEYLRAKGFSETPPERMP